MLSVVTSVYRTGQFLDAFVQRVDLAVRQCGITDVEMIFVIDGSPDDAIAKLRELKIRYPVIRIIELSRNFGHHAALWCGLEHAKGDMIFLADSDLETPPEIFRELHAALADPPIDVAFTCRPQREDPLIRRVASTLFWKLFGLLADVEIPRNILTECLMRRRYLDALLTLGDRNLFLAGMMQWVGFRKVAVPVSRTRREGPSSYSFAQRVGLAFDALTSFSTVPMNLLFVVGLGIAALAVTAAGGLMVIKLCRPATIVPGFTAVATLILFSLGVIVCAIGLVGLYLGKVFLQAKGRPRYIARLEE
jgi:putative glycosyltransferase